MSAARFDLADAGWFPVTLDLEARAAHFVRSRRGSLATQPFLDQKWDRSGLHHTAVRFEDLPSPSTTPRLSFIWHTSFCCSTLLAASLDSLGKCLPLKEPKVLVDLADAKRRGDLAVSPQLTAAVFGLLGRRFGAGEQIVVKPSNGANALIGEATTHTSGRMLLLHSDCRRFLVSTAKNGEPVRAFVRNLFMALLADRPQAVRWSSGDLLRLTDLQLAAIVWQLQMANLRRAAEALGDRARSLDSATFLADPRAALNGLDDFFELGLGKSVIARTVTGPDFRRDPKTAAGFDAADRAEQAAAAAGALGEDLDRIVDWSFKVCGWAAPDAALPNPLLSA